MSNEVNNPVVMVTNASAGFIFAEVLTIGVVFVTVVF